MGRAGTAGCRRRSRRACSIRRRASPGAQTRASWAARPTRASATADYAPAARARQIRDRLASLPSATPADMLAIQLDDRAEYRGALAADPRAGAALARARRRPRALVAGWSGHAAVDDAGLPPAAGIRAQRLGARLRRSSRRPPSRAGRTSLACAAAFHRCRAGAWSRRGRRTCSTRDSRTGMPGLPTSRRTRPRTCRSHARISRHAPGARSTSRRYATRSARPCRCSPAFLDMPAEPLPGDWSMPRVQSPDFGASERFGVSPGREAEGYLHMPGGQSGHPLSPFYRAGHADWAEGVRRHSCREPRPTS